MKNPLALLALAVLFLAGSRQELLAENRPDADPVQPADVVISHTPGSITFRLDEVAKPERRFSYATTGDKIAKEIKIDPDGGRALFEPPEYVVLHNSFAGAREMRGIGEDVLFQMLLQAWSQHRPVVLSPDAIWLVISQGLSWYVNSHPEEVRKAFVDHEGKRELTVLTNDLFSEQADWVGLVSGFTSEIAKYTNNDAAGTLVADFSTTGVDERIASKITLMDVVKPYFDYTAFYVVCGIPSITLTGTPEDWRKVQQKARALSNFGLGWWADMLDPILDEFVAAAEGHPDYWFWKDIVCKTRPRTIQGASCAKNPPKPTNVDGWFLKFFPFDGKGRTGDKVPVTKTMMSETVCVPFKYKVMTPAGGLISETDMELVGGIVGVQEDSSTFTLSPKIGWFVRVEKGKYEAGLKPAPGYLSDGGQDWGQIYNRPTEDRNYGGRRQVRMSTSLYYWDQGPLTRRNFSTRKSDTHMCEFLYGFDVQDSKLTVGNTSFYQPSTRTYMDPFRSWIDPVHINEGMLTNLQTSFDYVEVCRRRADNEIMAGAKFSFRDVYGFHLGVADDFINKLEEETAQGTDTSAVRFYADKVRAELDSLEDAASNLDFLLYPTRFGSGFHIGAGSEVFLGPASRYFTPLVGLNMGGDLMFGRVDVFLEMLLAWGGRFRQDIPLDGYSWSAGKKQKGGSMDISFGYTVKDALGYRFMPFVGIGVGFIDYPENPGNRTDNSGELKKSDEVSGLRLQAGIASDFKLHREIDRRWGMTSLSEFTFRTRFYVARTDLRRVNFSGSGLAFSSPAWTVNFGISLNMMNWIRAK